LENLLNLYENDPNILSQILPYVKNLFPCENLHPVLQVLANIARTQPGREGILDIDILPLVTSQNWVNQSPGPLCTQICRLGGNLCYDSPEGRRAVVDTNIMTKLEGILPGVSNDSDSWVVLPTFVHNFCADNPPGLDIVMNIVDIIAEQVSSGNYTSPEDLYQSYSNFICGLSGTEGNLKVLRRSKIIKAMLHIFEHSVDTEVKEMLLELLQELCEDETLSKGLLDEGLLRVFLSVGFLSKSYLDLLSLVSSHPSCLPLMTGGDSSLGGELAGWLGPSPAPPSPHHTAAAALIFGNYATSDAACSHLVTHTSVPASLVTHMVPESPPEVLHAVVGCLRNLSVCPAARDLLLGLFLHRACVQLLLQPPGSGSSHMVTPKLLATLRLVSQGSQEVSQELGADSRLLKRLAELGAVSVVPGLAIEVARLACSIVRYAGNSSTVSNVIDAQLVKVVLPLLNSSHPQLINEVLVCINLVCAPRPPHPSLVENTDFQFLVSKIKDILENQDIPQEMKINALTLTKSLLEWNFTAVTDTIKAENISDLILSFQTISSTHVSSIMKHL